MNKAFFKHKKVFFIGYAIGFITFLLYQYSGHKSESLISPQESLVWNIIENWSDHSLNYNNWLQSQHVRISNVDLDTYIYGAQHDGKYKNRQISESQWLKKKVPVTCIVFVEKLKLATTIKETWGQHCNYLLFFSQHLSELNLPVINLGIKFTSSWQLLCEVMNYIWKRRDEISLNWLIFVRDETFVIPDNLRFLLAPLDFREPHYLGHAVVLWGTAYNVAQAGYVLSYGVLQRLMEVFNNPEKCASGGKYWKKEDYYLGKHLASMGITPMDTRDSKQRGTFHGFPLNVLMWGVAKPDYYYTRALYPLGPDCCSTQTITFHIGEADKMRTMDYMLYHLRIFHDGGIYGNRPAPTPVPESEVWKLALRDEFNLTDIDDISSDRYFEIWRSKYSEPELFIAKKFRTGEAIPQPISKAFEMKSRELKTNDHL